MRKLWASLSELYKCRLNCLIKVFSLFKNRKIENLISFVFPTAVELIYVPRLFCL